MQNNEYDDLDNLPDLSLSDDERVARAGIEKKSGRQYGKEKQEGTRESGKKTGLKRSLFYLFCFIFLVGVVWQMDSLRGRVNDNNAKMNQIVSQVDKISGVMTTSGESVSRSTEQLGMQIQAVVQTQKKLEKNIDEIRKLAEDSRKDIANLRWRNKLDAGARSVQDKKTQELSEHLEGLAKDARRMSVSQLSIVAGIDERMEKMKKEILKSSSLAEKDNQQLLKGKLADYESALKSMDDYRLQINRRLLQVENSLRSLQKHNQKP